MKHQLLSKPVEVSPIQADEQNEDSMGMKGTTGLTLWIHCDLMFTRH